jgi:hypothetical protein
MASPRQKLFNWGGFFGRKNSVLSGTQAPSCKIAFFKQKFTLKCEWKLGLECEWPGSVHNEALVALWWLPQLSNENNTHWLLASAIFNAAKKETITALVDFIKLETFVTILPVFIKFATFKVIWSFLKILWDNLNKKMQSPNDYHSFVI